MYDFVYWYQKRYNTNIVNIFFFVKEHNWIILLHMNYLTVVKQPTVTFFKNWFLAGVTNFIEQLTIISQYLNEDKKDF